MLKVFVPSADEHLGGQIASPSDNADIWEGEI